MAITFYNGAPPDSYGSDGDGVLDYKNRLVWGPKGNVTAGSWASTAQNTVGQTGAGMLFNSGAPSSSLGQNGNAYSDLLQGNTWLKSNNAWSQIGSIQGPTGTTGSPLMTAFASTPGTYTALPATTLTSTPTVVPISGTTLPVYYTPTSSSALTGLYAYASAACTLTLYNVTTSAAVYNFSLSAGVPIVGNGGNYGFTTYPLVSGNTYQWQLTGSASTAFQMLPFWMTPAYTTNTPAIGIAGNAGLSASTTFSSSLTTLPVFGQAAGTRPWIYAPIRTGGIYSVQATYTPASGTPATASVTPVMNYDTNANLSSSRSLGLTLSAVTATGVPQTIMTPRVTDSTSLPANYYFWWQASGSGTGTLQIQLLPVV